MKIENCVALVTGANRGLGKAFCEALLAAGAQKVYAGARDPQSVQDTDDRVIPVRLDITKEMHVVNAAEVCHDVNLLINNAGIMNSSPMLAECSESLLRAEMEVNVFWRSSHGSCIRAGSRKKRRGHDRERPLSGELDRLPAQCHLRCIEACGTRYDRRCPISTQSPRDFRSGRVFPVILTPIWPRRSHTFPKISPLQVAERTLAGVEKNRDSVYADERTENMWKTLRADPDGLHATIQKMWDERHG